MHVAMVTLLPEDLDHPTGGVEAVAACLVRGLVARGIELTVLRVGSRSEKPYPANPDLGFRVVTIPLRRPPLLTNWLVTPCEVRRALRHVSPDLVHVQAHAEAYRGRPYPSVLTIHGVGYRDRALRGDWAAAPVSLGMKLTFSEAIRHHSNIILISPYVARELGERPGASYHHIPNPIEDRFFEIQRRPEPATVLYVGILERRKNIVGLVQAAAQLQGRFPHARYRLAGPWAAGYEARVREAMRRHGIAADRFEFLGSLDRSNLSEELARCAFLVIPSFQETAPMAVEEALAAGVPVIASSVGGLPWMIDHGRNGFLFDPHHGDQLAEAIGRLLQDAALRETMGRAARRHAEEHYRLATVLDRTIAVYEQALARSRAR